MPVVGTAGHVDHGKSTLIQRISGRDPDRWAEEKRRGLTIDLGFAWATLPGGIAVSFVDVPGHERFLKNMLAGIEAIDVALFVVAADEGWKPQSEEHLAVLDLLEVARGVVALTKADLVDEDLLGLAVDEVNEQLSGTSLEQARVIPVSAVTGLGIDDLLAELAAQMPSRPPDNSRPRLWVDRAFPVAGAGTVVTGTLLDAPLERDEEVEVYPTGLTSRIRSMQSHEEPADTVDAGRRVALNLGGVDHDQLGRGEMIGLPGQWIPSARFGASVELARFVDELDRRGAYQLHLGSSAHRVAISGIENGRAVFVLDEPLPMAVGDRYILRDTGRKLVVAGGRILDPAPGKTKSALQAMAQVDPAADANTRATVLLALRGADSVARLAAHSGGGVAVGAVEIGTRALTPGRIDELVDRAARLVELDHQDHPLRPGLPLATLARQLGVTADVAEVVVGRSDHLERIGPDITMTGREPQLTAEQEASWQAAVAKLEGGLAVPVESELGLDTEIISLKLRSGELVRIGPGLVYLPSQVAELKRLIEGLSGEFTVAQFRDAAGLSRKYAVPILEWSDKEGLTVRRGDNRHIR